MNSYNHQIDYIKIYKKYQYYLFFAKDIFKISLNLTNYFINVKIYFRLLFRVENKICDTKLCNMWKRKCKISKKTDYCNLKNV